MELEDLLKNADVQVVTPDAVRRKGTDDVILKILNDQNNFIKALITVTNDLKGRVETLEVRRRMEHE